MVRLETLKLEKHVAVTAAWSGWRGGVGLCFLNLQSEKSELTNICRSMSNHDPMQRCKNSRLNPCTLPIVETQAERMTNPMGPCYTL